MRQLKVGNYVIKASVMEVLEHLRIALTNGKLRDIKDGTENITVTCPAHGGGHESHPACNIYVGEDSKLTYGHFNCFVCGTSGSFLKFVALCFDSSEEYAKNWLLKQFEGELVEAALSIEPFTLKPKKQLTILDEKVLDAYQTWHPYLGQRKLSREICELFKVRYDPFYRQILFPAYDIFGRLVMIPKRSIDTKSFYLDKELEKPVYCLDYINKNNYKAAIITEGPFDCLTGWEYGFPTCATWGQPSPYQIEQLNKSSINILYLAFDNDEAGQRFARQIKRSLDKRILIKEVQLPPGRKDINECSREEFVACMQKAINSNGSISYNIKNTAAGQLHDKLKKYNLKKEI